MSEEKPNETILRQRLELMMKKEQIITNKESRAEIRYEIAQIRWQLGEITDEEFNEAEAFYESFYNELGQ